VLDTVVCENAMEEINMGFTGITLYASTLKKNVSLKMCFIRQHKN